MGMCPCITSTYLCQLGAALMSQIAEVKSKAKGLSPLNVVFFYLLLFFMPWNVIFCTIIWFYFSLLASRSHSKSISSALLDIRRAQQKAYGRLTRNPLVWRLVAVFIIIPNRCLIILQNPPATQPSGSFPRSLGPLPSFPPTSPVIFMDGVKSN